MSLKHKIKDLTKGGKNDLIGSYSRNVWILHFFFLMIIKEDSSVLLLVNRIPHLGSFVNKNLPMKQQSKFKRLRKNISDLQHWGKKKRCCYHLSCSCLFWLPIWYQDKFSFPLFTHHIIFFVNERRRKERR